MTAPIKIVRLDGIHLPSPTFSPSFAHSYTEYQLTPPNETATRLKDANVAITTTVHITSAILESCPNLKLVAVMAIGTDIVDVAACKERGVLVCNVPAASIESVAEHAISLYFAARRRTVRLHELVAGGTEWKARGSLNGVFGEGFPPTTGDEIMGVLGVGELGNTVAKIGKALGMRILFIERKGISPEAVREGRTHFEEALRTSTIIMITCPRTPETLNLISAPELALMRPNAIMVNVARGSIVDESCLVQALKEGKIGGAATDVFIQEPATKENSVLVKAAGEEWAQGKLTLSPHVAWWARSSIEKLRRTVTENIEAWARGEATNLV